MKKQGVFNRIRDAAAIDAAKAVEAGSRLTGHQGTSITGKAAMALAPTVLADLAGQVRKATFAVCGTNGKTTTNNILCAMLEAGGHKVVCNRLGANMLNGITGAYVSMSGLGGKLDADYACLEIDEASAARVFPHVHPDYLILTNLFRDQLDRYGEIDITIELLKKAIQMVPDMKLIINADDPLSVYLAMETGNPFVCYGIAEPDRGNEPESTVKSGEKQISHEIREGQFCKKCGAPLQYDYYQYGQMGKYRCTACDFRRPEPQYAAAGITTENGVNFLVEGLPVESDLRGLYSVYNLLAVWSALCEEGNQLLFPEKPTNMEESESGPDNRQTGTGQSGTEQPDTEQADTKLFNEVLRSYHTQFGRNETFCIDGHSVVLNLAKNPAGFNQNIEAMLEDREAKRLVIVINDNEQDGTDVSWLWDVDFDRIRDDSIKSVAVSGIRALDMCLRLKYVEIQADVAESPEAAIEGQLAKGQEKLYVLVNYTALFPIHRYLQEREKNA